MKKTIVCVMIMFVLITGLVFAAIGTESVISISKVNQDPDPAKAGEIMEVRFGLSNVGGADASNVVIEVAPEYPFELVPGEEAIQNIGTIQAGQGQTENTMKIVKYRLQVDKNANAGSYELKVKYYEEGSAASTQKSFSVDIEAKQSAEIIHIDKTTLVPGEQTGLKFIINNVGNAPLRDLTFYWQNSDGIILPVGSDNTRYIKYIDIGDSAEVDYQVIADTNAVAGLYKLDLHLTYEDSLTNTEKEIATIAGVYVGGGTDFDVAFSGSSSGQVSFTVANIGSNPASSVSVIVPQQRAWSVSGSNSVIIGNLNKGDYTVASFMLQSNGAMNRTANRIPNAGATGNTGAQGTSFNRSMQRFGNATSNNLLLQISYTDTMGQRKTVEKQVPMNSQSTATGSTAATFANGTVRRTTQNQSFLSKYKWYIIIIVVVVGLVLVYSRYKSRKLQNPNVKIKDIFKSKKK